MTAVAAKKVPTAKIPAKNARSKKAPAKGTQSKKEPVVTIRNDDTKWMEERCIPDAQRIKDIMGLEHGTLLDVGCGGGWLGVSLAHLTDMDFVLLDISPGCVKNSKENVGKFCFADRIQVMQGDSQDLPFDDETFDYVTTTSSIGFWHNPQKGIEECVRVLKPGGRMFIRGFDGNRYADFWRILKDTHFKEFAMTRKDGMEWIDIIKPAAKEN